MAGSLLNFRPLLETYDPNAGQEDIRQGMREASHYISKGIEAAGERGRQREKEFQSVFDVDVSKITDMESKNYLVSKYDQLKNDYVNKFQKNKNWLGHGKLSPREQIELRGDLDSLKSEAATLQILDKSLVEASDPKNRKWGYEVDNQKTKAYSEAKRTGDVTKMAQLLQSVGNSETGIPFVRYSDVNPDEYVKEQVSAIRKAIDTSTEITKKQSESGENIYDTTTKITKFGSPEDAKMTTYNVISKGDGGPVLEANLQRGSTLSDEEKRYAVEQYAGETQFPMLKYYTENKMDVSPIVEPKIETTKSQRLKTGSTRTGAKAKTIEKTELGWDYGTFPIKYSGDLNVDGKTMNVSGADNIGIEKRGNKYYAKFNVPRDIKSEMIKVQDKIDKEVADRYAEETKDIPVRKFKKKSDIKSKIKKEVNDKYESQLADKSKKKVITVPLEDVYDELAPKLEYNKMFLKGFNPDWQSEATQETKAKDSLGIL